MLWFSFTIFILVYGLLKTCYTEDKQQAFEKLYSDADDVKDQFLLRRTLAQSLKDCPSFIPSHGTDWILCTLTQHERESEETIRVFHGIMKHMNEFSYGMLTENMKWRAMCDVADCCLIGVGFFREHMERRHRMKAAPSVDYYSKMGALAYQRTGYEDLGEHFDDWTSFIEKEFMT